MQVGNGWIDDNMCGKGMYEYFWTHALNSDETHEGIQRHCDFENGNLTSECSKYQIRGDIEIGTIDIYGIYAPPCDSAATKAGASPATNSVSCISCSFAFLLRGVSTRSRELYLVM